MVLVSVGDDNTADAVFFALEIAIVGDDVVHAGHIALREHHTYVNDEDVAPVFQGHHVLSYFPQASQGNDL